MRTTRKLPSLRETNGGSSLVGDWKFIHSHILVRFLYLMFAAWVPFAPGFGQTPRPTQGRYITPREGETWADVEARIVREHDEARARRTARLQAMSSHELARSLIEGITDPTERRFTSSELFSRKDPDSTEAIVWLASTTAETKVRWAALELFQRCEPRLAPLLRRYVREWSEEAIEVLFQRAMVARCDLLEDVLALSFLEIWTGTYTPSVYIPFHKCADYSAIILAGSTDENVVGLLQKTLSRHPESFGLWLAATSIPTSTPEISKARELANVPESPFLLRTSVEIFLANTTGETSEDLTKTLRERVSQYNQTVELDLLRGQNHEETKEYQRFLIALAMLYFADDQVAKPLLQECLTSENASIQLTASVILGKRWPHEAIQSASSLPEGRFQKILTAVAVYFHPDFRDEAVAIVDPVELERYVSKCGDYALEGILLRGLGLGSQGIYFRD